MERRGERGAKRGSCRDAIFCVSTIVTRFYSSLVVYALNPFRVPENGGGFSYHGLHPGLFLFNHVVVVPEDVDGCVSGMTAINLLYSNFPLPTPDSRLQTSDFRLQTSDFFNH